MDADNIIMIIVWVVFIAFAVFSSVRKSKAAHDAAAAEAHKKGKETQPTFHEVMQQKRAAHDQRLKRPLNANPIKVPAADPIAVPPANPIQPPVANPIIVPASNPLPVEGQRVTKITRSAIQTAEKPSVEAQKARNELHDKAALKRAIILGQILQPKF